MHEAANIPRLVTCHDSDRKPVKSQQLATTALAYKCLLSASSTASDVLAGPYHRWCTTHRHFTRCRSDHRRVVSVRHVV
jgi:hypothetical protein